MSQEFVPSGFDVPIRFNGPGFQMEPLGPQHNERDHEAWMSSIDHIHATPGFEPPPTWPSLMSLEANLADLEMHARDFDERTGFTYTILDGDDLIGCVYIYPSQVADHDASVLSWVRVTRGDMDPVVYRSLSAWIAEAWPFKNPHYAPRPEAK